MGLKVLEKTGVKRPRINVGNEDEEQKRKKIKLDTEASKENINLNNNKGEEDLKILHYVGYKSLRAKRLRKEKTRSRFHRSVDERPRLQNVNDIHESIDNFLQSKYKLDLVIGSNLCDSNQFSIDTQELSESHTNWSNLVSLTPHHFESTLAQCHETQHPTKYENELNEAFIEESNPNPNETETEQLNTTIINAKDDAHTKIIDKGEVSNSEIAFKPGALRPQNDCQTDHDNSTINDGHLPNSPVKSELENVTNDSHDIKVEKDFEPRFVTVNEVQLPNFPVKTEPENIQNGLQYIKEDKDLETTSQTDSFIRYRDSNQSENFEEVEDFSSSNARKPTVSINCESRPNDPPYISSTILKDCQIIFQSEVRRTFKDTFDKVSDTNTQKYEFKLRDPELIRKAKLTVPQREWQTPSKIVKEAKFPAHQNVDQSKCKPKDFVSINGVTFPNFEINAETEEEHDNSQNFTRAIKVGEPLITKESNNNNNHGFTVKFGYVQVDTDGSCQHPGKPWATAGIGVYWGKDDHKMNVSRRVRGWKQTNNVAEIQAVCKAIEQAIDVNIDRLEINTDSQNVIKAGKFLRIRNDWCRRSRDRIDFQELDRLIWKAEYEKNMDIKWTKVKSHSNSRGNEMADRLAFLGSKKRY